MKIDFFLDIYELNKWMFSVYLIQIRPTESDSIWNEQKSAFILKLFWSLTYLM